MHDAALIEEWEYAPSFSHAIVFRILISKARGTHPQYFVLVVIFQGTVDGCHKNKAATKHMYTVGITIQKEKM